MRIAGFRSSGLDSEAPDLEPQPITAVLFDFSNTLFHAMDAPEWLRGAARAHGITLDEQDVARLLTELEKAWSRPDVAAAQEGRDLSPRPTGQPGSPGSARSRSWPRWLSSSTRL